MKTITINNFNEIPKNYTGHVRLNGGIECWLRKGKLHREDGPAVTYKDGSYVCYKNGVQIEFFEPKEKVKKVIIKNTPLGTIAEDILKAWEIDKWVSDKEVLEDIICAISEAYVRGRDEKEAIS